MSKRWRNTTYLSDSVADGESPMLSSSADGSRVKRRIVLAPFQNYYQACVDFMGYPLLVSGSNALGAACRYISRSIPHGFRGVSPNISPPPDEVYRQGATAQIYSYQNPVGRTRLEVVLFGWLFCKTQPGMANVQPLGKDGIVQLAGALPGAGAFLDPAVAGYNTNKLDLEYRTLSYTVVPDYWSTLLNIGGPLQSAPLGTPPIIVPDEGCFNANGFPPRYVTAYLRTAKKIINLRRGLMYYVAEPGQETKGVPIPDGIPIEVPTGTLTVIWHEVPRGGIPFNAIVLCQGAIFDGTFFGLPASTLLFDSWDYKEEYSILGQRIFTLTYIFKFLPNVDLTGVARGWNYTLRKVPGSNTVDYRRILSTASPTMAAPGNGPYRVADFRTLFRPDQP